MTRSRFVHVGSSIGVSLAAICVALALSFVLIELTGHDGGAALEALWQGAFGSAAQFGGTLNKSIPLMLVALGWIVAARARRINIGFEGQILIGGTFATVVALHLSGVPAVVHLPAAVMAGVLGGALWAGVAALLWARRGVNEVISTLLLSFVAAQIVAWLVRGPLQEPSGGLNQSEPIPSSARWPGLLAGNSVTWELFLALLAVLAIAFLIARTTFGFRLHATGANEQAARYSGIRASRVTVAALGISGGLAGLAGSSLILSGYSGTMTDNFSANYGFEGIVVALVARNHPLACVPAALLFAALRQGSGLMEAQVGVPASIIIMTQGLVIVLLAGGAYLTGQAPRLRGRMAIEASGRDASLGTAPPAAPSGPHGAAEKG